MLDLLWSVACSSIIFVIFRAYKTYRIDTFFAIVVNYMTAFAVGILFFDLPFSIWVLPSRPWFWPALAMGALFIVIFNLMAQTSQSLGVSVASVATKMSLVIPVVAGVLVYDERLGILKSVGILLALAAVYFSSIRSGTLKIDPRSLYLPFLVFLGSGVIDLSLKYLQQTQIPEEEFPLFSALVFASAGSAGLGTTLIKFPRRLIHYRPANLLGGVVLGIPNFFSIFFLLRALKNPIWNSATIFTLNNVAIVLLTTLLGVLLFRESLSLKNKAGIGLAVASILLLSLT